MSQISQPVRIALLAVIVIAAAWFMLLRPHPQATPPAPAPAPAPAPTTAAKPAPSSASSSPLPPGVAGLVRAVNHARGAVSASQAEANKFSQANAATPAKPAANAGASSAPGAAKPAPAASAATPHPNSSAPVAASAAPSAAPPSTTTATARLLAGTTAARVAVAAAATATSKAKPAAARVSRPQLSPLQQVQQELGEGKVVVILFWNPNGSDDQSVRHQLSLIDHQYGNVVTHVATPEQVASFGTVTSVVSLVQTPTIVIVNPKGQATTITGLADYQAIDQAVNDAEQAAGTDQLPSLTAFTGGSPRAQYVKRVNAMCSRTIHKAGVFRVNYDSSSSMSAAVAWVSKVNSAILANVLKLNPPAGDAAYIESAIGHERRAEAALQTDVRDMQAGRTVNARNDTLTVQTEDNRAGVMFATYGLTSCISPVTGG